MNPLNLSQENLEKFKRIFKNPDDMLVLQTNGSISDLIPAYDLAEVNVDNDGKLDVGTWAAEYTCDAMKKPPLCNDATTPEKLLEWLTSDDFDVISFVTGKKKINKINWNQLVSEIPEN